jgi:hypothetical protein
MIGNDYNKRNNNVENLVKCELLCGINLYYKYMSHDYIKNKNLKL